MPTLRQATIRLAHEDEELRPLLLPLLTAAEDEDEDEKEGKFERGEDVPLSEMPKKLQENAKDPPPSVQKVKEKIKSKAKKGSVPEQELFDAALKLAGESPEYGEHLLPVLEKFADSVVPGDPPNPSDERANEMGWDPGKTEDGEAEGKTARLIEAVVAGPADVQRYYKTCRTDYPDKPKEYCARVAWNIYCAYKNPDHPGCTEFGKTWGPPYSGPLSKAASDALEKVRLGGDQVLSVEEVRFLCGSCADKMEAKGLSGLKVSTLLDSPDFLGPVDQERALLHDAIKLATDNPEIRDRLLPAIREATLLPLLEEDIEMLREAKKAPPKKTYPPYEGGSKWEKMPTGWTAESRKKFWESLTGSAKHKVTQCMKKMDGKVTNPGQFCAALADRVVGKEWRSRRASTEWLTVEQVRELCPSCADKMASYNMRMVKASVLRRAIEMQKDK